MSEYRSLDELFSEIDGDPSYAQLPPDRLAAHSLARNVLRLRLSAGLTQAELANRAGMRQPRIAEIESSKGRPRFDTLVKVSGALGVPMSDLVADIGAHEEEAVVELATVRLSGERSLRDGAEYLAASVSAHVGRVCAFDLAPDAA